MMLVYSSTIEMVFIFFYEKISHGPNQKVLERILTLSLPLWCLL